MTSLTDSAKSKQKSGAIGHRREAKGCGPPITVKQSDSGPPTLGESRTTTKQSLTAADFEAFRCRRGYRGRPIAWRWRRAQELVATGDPYDPRRDDELVERIHSYLALAHDDPQAAAEADPPFAKAERVFRQGGENEALLRAWVLTALPASEVAKRVGLDLEVVEAYVAGFFDIQDRRSCRNWVVQSAIRLHSRRFHDFTEAEHVAWQLEGLDGPLALQGMLELARFATYRGGETSQHIDAEILRIQKYQLYVLLLTSPLCYGNPVAWQQLYIEQRKLELDRQRQSRIKKSSRRKTRHYARQCSTRNSSYGTGDPVGIIESILLSFRPQRSSGSQDLLRPRRNVASNVRPDDDHGTDACGA